MALQPGLSIEMTHRVSEEITAHRLGNEGFHVLATPIIVAWFEEAARTLAAAHVGQGQGTVGTLITAKHLAATPVGMAVRVTATLREVDGRRLLFDVEAHDDEEKIAEGQNERFVVNLERFLSKVGHKQRS